MGDTKRVLILTADVGFGHRSTAIAIEAALDDLYGELCQAEIVNPLDDKRVLPILRDQQEDYDKMVRQMPDVYKLGYQIGDTQIPAAITESAFVVMLFYVVRDIIKHFQPDVIFTTHPMFVAPLNAYLTLHKPAIPFLTVVTDLTDVHRLWFNEGTELCLVPTQEAYRQAISSGMPPEKVQVTGIPIHPNFVKETRQPAAIRADLGWDPYAITALVVGSKRVKNLMNVLHVLNHSGLPLQLVLVAGGDDGLYEKLKATHWHLPAYIYNFVNQMPAFMHASDLIIGKAGGLIVTESLACGLPQLLVDVTPGQESGNASYVVEHGVGELAKTPVDALEVLCHWLEHDARLLADRARISRSLGRPRSAYTAAELAWQIAERARIERPLLPTSHHLDAGRRLRELLATFGISSTDES